MNNSTLDLIGLTPLVKLKGEFACPIYAKLEMFNPGGSAKDRSALKMVESAERAGLLKPGATIVEASSGNQGIALAMIGAVKGYKVIITVSAKISKEKTKTLQAYGARVVRCKNAAHNDAQGYYMTAKKIAQHIKGAYFPDQYNNQLNPLAHEQWTGPEVWKQTKGKITHFFAAAGTMGTVMGVGRYLKNKNPKIKIIAVDAANSAFSNSSPKPYKVEGLGVDSVPDFYDNSIIDEVIAIKDEQAFASCRKLAKKQGLLVGGSSGAVFAALEKYKLRFKKNDFVVGLFVDSGKPYLDKIF